MPILLATVVGPRTGHVTQAGPIRSFPGNAIWKLEEALSLPGFSCWETDLDPVIPAPDPRGNQQRQVERGGGETEV